MSSIAFVALSSPGVATRAPNGDVSDVPVATTTTPAASQKESGDVARPAPPGPRQAAPSPPRYGSRWRALCARRDELKDKLAAKKWQGAGYLPGVNRNVSLTYTLEFGAKAYETLRAQHGNGQAASWITWSRCGSYAIDMATQIIHLSAMTRSRSERHEWRPPTSIFDCWYIPESHSESLEAIDQAYHDAFGASPTGPFQEQPVLALVPDGDSYTMWKIPNPPPENDPDADPGPPAGLLHGVREHCFDHSVMGL